MNDNDATATDKPSRRPPWNKGKLIGVKPPLRQGHVWSIRTRLQLERRTRDLALFSLAIDSKLRGCDAAAVRVDDVAPNGYADPMISDTRLTIGAQIKGMTDKDIIDIFNRVMAAQEKLLGDWDRTVTEMLPGARQIEYRKDLDQLVPLAEVIRCYVDDGGEDGEVTVHIDGNELSLAEFGQLLKSYAGWGMRVTFVPEERLTENPTPVQQRPKKSRER